MLEKWMRWIFGYVEFQINGKYAERFLSLVAHNGIHLWNIEKEKELKASASISSYREMYPYKRRCRIKTKILKKHGLPFWLKCLKTRKGLIIGAVIFAVVYFFLSSYVWSVNVEGNDQLKTEEVLQAARECGLESGTLKSHLDSYSLETKMMRALPQLSWVSVNRYGCAVSISIKEKIETPEITETKNPSNLIASGEGQVIALEIWGGEAKVKVGDGVVKGQLLVSGVSNPEENHFALNRSYGKVLAETRHTLSVTVPKKKEIKTFSKEAVYRCSVRVFGVQIPLTFCGIPKGEYERSAAEEPFCLGGITLPLSVLKEKWSKIEREEQSVSLKEAEAEGEKQLQQLFAETYPRAEITKKNVSVTELKDGYSIKWEVLCKEDIAVEKPLLGE